MARYTVAPKPLEQRETSPVSTQRRQDGTLFLDFGRAAFGTLLLPTAGIPNDGSLLVHLGEKLTRQGRIDRHPPACIRYIRIVPEPATDSPTTRVRIPPDTRNTGPHAIPMPASIGEVFPFRYAEIEGGNYLHAGDIRRVSVQYPFDDSAAAFTSSDPVLNAVWDLCQYSIKATTFCGVYVDGDRERIPYEGDAYIQQLGHYCLDAEYALARYSHEYLLQHPTWPTDWQLHSVPMAWADYLYSGETLSLRTFYADLCTKTLVELARPDGLISTQSEQCNRKFLEKLHFTGDRNADGRGIRDLVDWPPGSFTDGGTGERDGHDMRPVNTVVNALHAWNLALMARIAKALGFQEDRRRFAEQAQRVCTTMNRLLFDPRRGVYLDGEGSSHASLHSNMFMLAFDLVPPERIASVMTFVKSRGMACSVYGAQYLLEALYRHGESEYALSLLTAQHDRSWWNMLQAGTTITMEAWDLKYKNNLDWNHAWGAVPANIIPRYLLGIRPREPGFRKVVVHPQLASLRKASGVQPTPLGPIKLAVEHVPGGGQGHMRLELPEGISASVRVPSPPGPALTLFVNGSQVEAKKMRHALLLEPVEAGTCQIDWTTDSHPLR